MQPDSPDELGQLIERTRLARLEGEGTAASAIIAELKQQLE